MIKYLFTSQTHTQVQPLVAPILWKSSQSCQFIYNLLAWTRFDSFELLLWFDYFHWKHHFIYFISPRSFNSELRLQEEGAGGWEDVQSSLPTASEQATWPASFQFNSNSNSDFDSYFHNNKSTNQQHRWKLEYLFLWGAIMEWIHRDSLSLRVRAGFK